MKSLFFLLCMLNCIATNTVRENFNDAVSKLENDINAGLECGVIVYDVLSGYYFYRNYFSYSQNTIINSNNNNTELLDNNEVCYIDDQSDIVESISHYRNAKYVLIASIAVIVLLTLTTKGNPYVIDSNKQKSLKDALDVLEKEHDLCGWGLLIYGSIMEEIIFRLIIQSSLNYASEKILMLLLFDGEKKTNIDSQFFSLVISSVLFGLCHLRNANPQWGQVIITAIGGYYMGSVFNSNGIIASMVCHLEHNCIANFITTIIFWSIYGYITLQRWYEYKNLNP